MKIFLWRIAVNGFFWLRHPVLIAYFYRRTGCFPDIAFPRSINEKFLWRKLVDRNPGFITLSDKIACKAWVAKQVPELNISPVRWEGSSIDALPEELISRAGVLKANHGCGTNLLVEEGGISRAEIERVASDWLSYNHGYEHGEWAYSCVPRKYFWEDLIAGVSRDLDEVKIFTFGKEVKRIVHISGRFSEIRANAWEYDPNGELISSPEQATVAGQDHKLTLPAGIEEAVDIASLLGSHFDHVRVDLLFDGAHWWLGEITVYNQAGYMYIPSASDPDSSLSRSWDIRNAYFFNGQPKGFIASCYANVLNQFLLR